MCSSILGAVLCCNGSHAVQLAERKAPLKRYNMNTIAMAEKMLQRSTLRDANERPTKGFDEYEPLSELLDFDVTIGNEGSLPRRPEPESEALTGDFSACDEEIDAGTKGRRSTI